MITLSPGVTLTSLSPHHEQCLQPAANICKTLFALKDPLDSSPRTLTPSLQDRPGLSQDQAAPAGLATWQ